LPASTLPPSTSTSSMSSTSTMPNNSRQVLARLDTSRKGYLSQTDVSSNSYLSSHFATCDTNGDGKLTENELSTCIQSAPSGTSFQ
jgi:Ca2+-binding EF-hand superfamily protein